MENFGKRSLEEVKEKLSELELGLKMRVNVEAFETEKATKAKEKRASG